MNRQSGFLNIAHRGGGKLVPENTIEAYRNSLAVGADTLEGDVHMTTDGYVVVSHDDTVNRCTDGKGKIKEKTLAEIRELDAGYDFTTDLGRTHPYRGMGLRMPTLEEVFSDSVLNRAPMVLEIKQEGEEIVDRVLDLIEKYDMADRLMMGAFNQSTLDLIKEKGADRGMDLIRCFSTEGVLKFMLTPIAKMKEADYIMPGEILALPGILVSPTLVNKARKLGVKITVWTVNTKAEMEWYKNVMRVDGIMTDDPELLNEVVNR